MLGILKWESLGIDLAIATEPASVDIHMDRNCRFSHNYVGLIFLDPGVHLRLSYEKRHYRIDILAEALRGTL